MSSYYHSRPVHLLTAFLLVIVLCAGALGKPSAVKAQDTPPTEPQIEIISPYFSLIHQTTADGIELEGEVINGPATPPEEFAAEHALNAIDGEVQGTLPNFPAYTWVFGCSAVSAAMIAAYADRGSFPNMYTGPTNGGVMPLDNSSWGTWSDGDETYPNNPLIASHQGVDGRATKGSIDDYWVMYGSSTQDPYITGGWTQHSWGDAIGDYMKTSQSAYNNTDGSTQFWTYTSNTGKLSCADIVSGGITNDGTVGRKLFYEARGYTVTDCYNQKTDNNGGGFTLANYQAEIDAGYPVFLNLQGHSVVGYGYTGNTVYIRDTWDTSSHSFTWGTSYSGMALLSVSVVHPQLATIPSEAKLYLPMAVKPIPNNAPTDISLSSTIVEENKPVNTVVATITASDPDAGNTFSFALVAGSGSADNASFNVSGNKLRTSAVFDYDVKNVYYIRLRATDQGGLKYEEAFVINVTPVGLANFLNPGFEQGAANWTQYSLHGATLIMLASDTPVSAHGGSWITWLGGLDSEVSQVSQSVTISSAAPYLHFWYWIASEDVCGYDFFRVKVNNSIVGSINLCEGNNTGGWVEAIINLSAYVGTGKTVLFEVTTDVSLNSNLFLDDISMFASAQASEEPAPLTEFDPALIIAPKP